MTRDKIHAVVLETFSTVLKKPFTPGAEVVRENEAAWDSLKHMEIIFALEEKFGVRFTEEEMVELKSASGIVEKIEFHHAA
ncbi:MAG: acyl carrier protein [Syntrophobacteraceae bacterium]